MFTKYGYSITQEPYGKSGDILVWIRKNGGHIGFIEKPVDRFTWRTIEANTSPGTAGSQYDGDGVWRRVRTYEPFNTFRITHYVPVRY